MDSSVMDRGIHRSLPIKLSDSLVKRFWASVSVGEPNECWNWIASLRSGYGAIKHAGRVYSAHRVSYTIHHGKIPKGMVVMHSCDNRKCCNPRHLSAGTPLQNNRDSMAKGINRVHGERCWNAKLTDAIVLEIMRLRATGLGAWRIAKKLGLPKKPVERVVYGYGWTHITGLSRAQRHEVA